MTLRDPIAFDIGGANLKAATADGVISLPFPLWKMPDELAVTLERLASELGSPAGPWQITMTGELADCYATKEEGVRRILAGATIAARGAPIQVWSTDGRFVTVDEACVKPLSVAAANWHALASVVAMSCPGEAGLLIDIGSTTTDIIPWADGRVTAYGRTDVTRMLSGELVYTGIRRTPLCAVATAVPFRGEKVPVAAELFATMLDAYLLAGVIPESEDDRDTADGRPATIAAAHARIARMLCGDSTEVTLAECRELATFWIHAQLAQITSALDRVLARGSQRLTRIVLSGSGESIAKAAVDRHPRLCDVTTTSLHEIYGAERSTAACAVALLFLASGERLEFA